MTRPGFVRRPRADVLLVGETEPEVQPWLRAAGHAIRGARDVEEALAALDVSPADLVIVDREPAGLEVAEVCRSLRADPRLADAWLLGITRRPDDALLDMGCDATLARPFTRAQLLARTRAGLRAARRRADGSLLQALMVNVPGAIYRSAWHNNFALELVSEEIERISGYPPANFVASTRRTLRSIVHPEDEAALEAAIAEVRETMESFSIEYRIIRADGEIRWVLDRGQLVRGPGGRLWMDGAIFDVTERRQAEEALRRRAVEEARTAEVRASAARIVAAADAARRKIERDLHDGAQQRLVALALDVRVAKSRIAKDPSAAAGLLDRIGADLAAASSELRELARGIHPAVLTERGLGPAIESLVTRAPVPVDVLGVPAERLPTATESTAYFTVAEALTNVAKYAQATHATVSVAQENGSLVVEIGDDGVGGADAANGSGLRGLQDRVTANDGELIVVSPPGEGTTIRAVLPLG